MVMSYLRKVEMSSGCRHLLRRRQNLDAHRQPDIGPPGGYGYTGAFRIDDVALISYHSLLGKQDPGSARQLHRGIEGGPVTTPLRTSSPRPTYLRNTRSRAGLS